MAEIIIGKVCPTFKGEWDGTTMYERLDVVLWNGSSYICLKDKSIITNPGSKAAWQMIASKGDSGDINGTLGNKTFNDF